MKIVHLFPEINKGGTERIVLSLAQIQQQNHSVDIIVFSKKNLYPFLTQNLNIHFITEPTFVEYGFRGIKRQSIASLEKKLLEINPNIIHSHSYWTDLLLMSIPKIENAKYISSLHLFYPIYDASLGFSKKSITDFLDKKRLMRNFKKYNVSLISVSKSSYNHYFKRLPLHLKSKLHLIENGVDLSDFPKNTKIFDFHNLEKQKTKNILSVGRLIPEKGHSFLIAVATILLEKGFDSFILRIAGDGPYRKNLQKEINVKKLENHVFLLGNIDNILPEYQKSDLYIHASEKETFGLCFIEALAVGVPCIITKESDSGVIDNGINGFVVEKKAAEFANQIITLLSDSILYEKIKNKTRSSVLKFNFSDFSNKIETVYKT